MKKALFFGAFIFFGSICFSENSIDLGEVTTFITDLSDTDKVTFDNQEIENSHASDLSQFLESEGILVMNTGGTGSMSNISINGYAGFCIKVYVDGVMANNPTTGEFDWNSIDLNSIQSISVEYSPVEGQLEFSGATINIKTKMFSGESGKIEYETKSYQKSLFDTNIFKCTYNNVLGSVCYKLDFDFQSAQNNFETRRLETNKGNENRLGNAGVSFIRYYDDVELSGNFRTAYNQYACDLPDLIDGVGVEKDLNTSESVRVNTKEYGNYVFSHQFVKVDYNSTHNNVSSFELKAVNPLKYGFSVNSFIKDEDSRTFKANRFEAGISPCFEFQIKKFAKLNLCAGNCLYTYDWKKLNYNFVPSVSVSSIWGITYSAYRAFILPTFNQLYWKGAGFHGNNTLTPEDGFGQALSFKNEKIPFYGMLTQSIYGNKIRWTGSDKTGSFAENVGTGYYWGFVAGSSFKWNHFCYDTNVTYTHATIDSYSGNQIMWVPRWQAHLNLAGNWKYCTVRTDFNFCGKRAKDNFHTAFYNPYFLLGVSCELKPSEKVSLIIKGENLLDERYLYHDNYCAPSRSISMLVRMCL